MADLRTTRRRMTSVPNKTLGAAVARLRDRSGLTQTELARRAGVGSSSTISRLENGLSGQASFDLVHKLSEALEEPNELWAASGVIPEAAVTMLAPWWLAFTSEHLYERTTPVVRGVHLGGLAQEFLNNAAGALGTGSRVHTERMAAALTPPREIRRVLGEKPAVRLEDNAIVIVRTKTPRPVDGEDAVDLSDRDLVLTRFLEAHAIAHVLLEHTGCGWPRNVQAEAAADDLAAHLLVPPFILNNVFRRALAETGRDVHTDGWSPGSAAVVEQVARRVAAPAWVVIRRLAEDGLLQTESQEAL